MFHFTTSYFRILRLLFKNGTNQATLVSKKFDEAAKMQQWKYKKNNSHLGRTRPILQLYKQGKKCTDQGRNK